MKNMYIKTLCVLATCAFACGAQATKYYLDDGVLRPTSADVNLEDSASCWKVYENGAYKEYGSVPNFTENDDIEFKYVTNAPWGGGGPGGSLILSNNLTVNSITMSCAAGIYSEDEITIKTIGNFDTNTVSNAVAGAGVSVEIGGNSTNVQNGYFGTAEPTVDNAVKGGAIKSLKVTGTFTVQTTNTTFYANGVENHSINNCDVQLNELKGISSDTASPLFTYGSRKGATLHAVVDKDCFMSVKKVTGDISVAIAGNPSSSGKLIIVFENNADATTNGGIDSETFCASAGSTISLIMRGDSNYTQYFKGNYDKTLIDSDNYLGSIRFKGGVELISGNLRLSYKATGANESHGVLTMNKSASATKASFGNAIDGEVGSFAFDKIVANGDGEIAVQIVDKTSFDQIVLTAGEIEGTGTIAFDFGSVEDCKKLIADSAENGVKLISWTLNENTEVAANFAAVAGQTSFNQDGVDYAFDSFVGNDGVYVAYVAVPEPSTYAVIFGALALSFAIYRRRK